MAEQHLLWIEPDQLDSRSQDLKDGLEEAFGNLTIKSVAGGQKALAALARDPSQFSVVVIDTQEPSKPTAVLVQRIKEINPGVETIILRTDEVTWESLGLPRYSRPLLLLQPVSCDALISCVAKLQEMAEAREDYLTLSRGIKRRVSMSRKNIEAVLALLYRQIGVGMITLRQDGYFTFYSPEARRLTGYSQEELPHVQKWVSALLVDPNTAQTTLADLDQMWIEASGRSRVRHTIRRKDGRLVTLSMTVLVLLGDEGEPRQLVILLFDPWERASSREFEQILDWGPLGIYSYYHGVGFVHFSPTALGLLNRAFDLDLVLDDVLGRQIKDLPLPAATVQTWEKMVQLVSNGCGPEMAPPLGLPGKRLLGHTFAAQVELENSEGIGVVAVLEAREDLLAVSQQDIPARELFKLTLQGIPQPFMLLRAVRNEEGAIVRFQGYGINRAARNLLGLWPESGPLVDLEDIFPDPTTRSWIYQQAVEITETGQDQSVEVRVLLPQSQPQNRVIHFWLGKIGDGVALFFRDVTAKRQEEKLLKQYQHLFAHMQEAIIVTDLDGLIIDWNPASERMFGYNKEKIMGQPAQILTLDGQGEPLSQDNESIFREGDVWKSEYEFVRQDGSTGLASSIFGLLKDDEGRPYGTVGLSHDVTERKRLEARLTSQTQQLQEKNIALNTLLRHAEDERLRACQQVAADLCQRVTERIHQIVEKKDNPQLVHSLGTLLLEDLGQVPDRGQGEITPDDPTIKLSDKEMEVARLIRGGKTTEEIAFLLDKSVDTIRLQRISIRKKLGLTRRDRNLANYLKRIELI